MLVIIRDDPESGEMYLRQFEQPLEPASFLAPGVDPVGHQSLAGERTEVPDHVVVAYVAMLAQTLTMDDLLRFYDEHGEKR